jgi:AAA15 family ATPase/GTPase
MHLKSLHIQNFRSLEDFKVSKLGRINLIVGKNNSGKSSVLEALRIYAANAHPAVLDVIATSHNEPSLLNAPEIFESLAEKPFEDFFTGRKYPSQDGEKISIGELENNSSALAIEHILINRTQETVREGIEETTKTSAKIVKKIDAAREKSEYNIETLHVLKDSLHGFIELNEKFLTAQKNIFDTAKTIPCSYIPTQFISMAELAGIWDEVQFSEHGDFVKEGLKFINEDFENIAFVVNSSENFNKIKGLIARAQAQYGLQRTAKIKLKNQTKAIPLNSMGDGMVRVLQLLLKVYPAKGGFLLIDEFENGLHYSVQEKIWQFLFDLAEKLDIQVFATTHSWDCIESFAKVAVKNTRSEGVLFRVGRSVRNSDQGKVIATVFDEEQLLNITQTDVEVR